MRRTRGTRWSSLGVGIVSTAFGRMENVIMIGVYGGSMACCISHELP